MTDIDVTKVEEIIRRVAAETVMPRFNNMLESEIREKGPGDFVTIADEESEKTFSKLLPELLPGSLVVGEEAVAKDGTVVEKLKGEQPVWVIDPVDGTYNFSHGIRKFGILVSLVQNGETLYGWAFDAPGDRMAVAGRGAGTFLDGARVKTSCAAAEEKELRGRGSGFRGAEHFKELVAQRCSLHDYMDFITGDADFVVHMPKVTPWDHGATNLIAAEAGGFVAMNDPDTLYDPTLYGWAFLLVAPDRDWWEKLSPLLYPAHLKARIAGK